MGAITDDTQMTLITAEGLIRAVVRGHTRGMVSTPSVVHHALLRWLITQDMEPGLAGDLIRDKIDRHSGLIVDKRLWSRRGPGRTCTSALLEHRHGFGQYAQNNSKGCGGVMRSAPCAFMGDAFEIACDTARLTHGHPTGYLAAGLFAHIVQQLLHSKNKGPAKLKHIVQSALEHYGEIEAMEETRSAVTEVLMLVENGHQPTLTNIDAFGGGWVAEEALGIALWCALSAKSLEHGIIMAVNHGGDSDSTGSIAGNLLGVMYGLEAIPQRWLSKLELYEVIARVGRELIEVPRKCWEQGEDLDVDILRQYPGD